MGDGAGSKPLRLPTAGWVLLSLYPDEETEGQKDEALAQSPVWLVESLGR